MPRYTIKLTREEVGDLNAIITKGKHTSQTYRAAYVLLNCDKGQYAKDRTITNAEIAKVFVNWRPNNRSDKEEVY